MTDEGPRQEATFPGPHDSGQRQAEELKIASILLTHTPLLLDSGMIGTAQRLSITSASELPRQQY